MSILSLPSASRTRTTSPRPVMASIAARWTDLVLAWRHRQAERTMLALSDAILHDIGVARSEIATVARHGRSPRR
ncbi:hypothetical protein P7D22_20325 [Lichenihabitans sp. Uapishka_5]|uniref:hypothetical protein n=1 Tax=Lichenihabitans sp. Uapishka_5 TaxID=3037302 RepID=UPI0029E7D654|nr:hypothetical protein [Lichenihabitans sp. Uapishka_5]MDX7953515.1 hypothetical protein [Lichenihabitans sp. Uapishka_5]